KRVFKNWGFVFIVAIIASLPFSAQYLTSLEPASVDKRQEIEREISQIDKADIKELTNEKIGKEDKYQGLTEGELRIENVSNNATIEEKIDAIMQAEDLAGTLTGVSIRHADTGESLYSHFGDIQVRPASNMKILTSIAALEVLGPDYQFSTDVLTDGEVVGSELQGNLYLKGKGDPTLLKEDFDQFAKELKEQGIMEISGDIIGDDRWFDDVRLSED